MARHAQSRSRNALAAERTSQAVDAAAPAPTPTAAGPQRKAGKGEALAPRDDGEKDLKDSIRDDRRKQILQAAVKVFAERGYHGCRISDVAEAAGVAYGLVYHYYGNKDGLLSAVFDVNWAFLPKLSMRSRPHNRACVRSSR